MFMVRRGGTRGGWIAVLRCPDARTAEDVYDRWVSQFPQQVIELTSGPVVVVRRYPSESAMGGPATGDPAPVSPGELHPSA